MIHQPIKSKQKQQRQRRSWMIEMRHWRSIEIVVDGEEVDAWKGRVKVSNLMRSLMENKQSATQSKVGFVCLKMVAIWVRGRDWKSSSSSTNWGGLSWSAFFIFRQGRTGLSIWERERNGFSSFARGGCSSFWLREDLSYWGWLNFFL